MTEQANAPITRRTLRAAAAAATSPSPTAPAAGAGSPAPAPATLTRRAIREAERARELVVVSVPTQASPPRVEALRRRPVPEASAPAPSSSALRSTAVPSPAAPSPAAPTATPAPAPAPTVTRRELRLAAQEAQRRRRAGESPAICRPPFAATVVVPAQQVRASQARAVVSRIGARPLVVLALSASVLVGGVTQVHAEQTDAARSAAAATAERIERAQRTEAARYAAKAAAVAAEQREQALAVAEEVVDVAQQVRDRSADVVDAETLASLEVATAELTQLLDSAPAVEALSAATEVDLEAADAPAEAIATDGVESVAATPSPEASAEPSPEPAPDADAAATTSAEAAAELRTGRASRSGADGRALPLTTDRVAAHALGTSDATVVREQLAALDLDTSTKILQAASQVSELSAQVEATADALLAELEAQRAAEEAARQAAAEAERKAAEERARKIAVAQSAANGEIPVDVLCGVGFQADVLLRCDAAEALERLNEAYKAAFGRDLRVVSSYRSFSAQIATKRSRGYLAARPGTSNHGKAIAVDLGDFGGVGDFSSANHRWVREHGPAFGWHHPEIMRPGGGGPQEPWHFEYHG